VCSGRSPSTNPGASPPANGKPPPSVLTYEPLSRERRDDA
jgi:hypothetical protein